MPHGAAQADGWLHEAAPAKVNLYLRIVGRRLDGYHLLDSLAVFPAVGDVLRAAPAATLALSTIGPFGAALARESDNLVLRAANLLDPTRGASLVLEKNLPIASGIGGGSADAAASLRLLARMWDVQLDVAAVTLGADVPVCLASQPARMGGIGDALTPAPLLPAFGMVLVNPGVAVATPAVFKARASKGDDFSSPATLPAAWAHAAAMAADLEPLGNDLEQAAIALCPPIALVLAALARLPGCLLARMSGSGATCFALFDTPATAAEAAASLRRPGWWVWGGAGAHPGLAPVPPGT